MITAKLLNHMGTDIDVVKSAKVSFDNDEDVQPLGWVNDKPILTSDQIGLIKYLVRGIPKQEYLDMIANPTSEAFWKFRQTPIHAAPFGHCFLSFMIEAPVFVARQMVKHEYLRMSEISRRYNKGQPVFFKPEKWSGIAAKIKQGAGEYLDHNGQDRANDCYSEAVFSASDEYKNLLKFVAPEESRIVLPLCHMTRWRWSGSLDAFMNMLIMRLDPHSQSQTRYLAGLIAEQVRNEFPVSYSAYVEGNIV